MDVKSDSKIDKKYIKGTLLTLLWACILLVAYHLLRLQPEELAASQSLTYFVIYGLAPSFILLCLAIWFICYSINKYIQLKTQYDALLFQSLNKDLADSINLVNSNTEKGQATINQLQKTIKDLEDELKSKNNSCSS